MKITNPYGPNTTVLLPGTCNAKCAFCFWDRKEGLIKPPEDYLDRVFSNISNLPDEFRVLSISGGEPTISPMFGRFILRLSRYRREHRLDRVVLTTHGGNLDNHIPLIDCAVDHVNISRHAIGTAANAVVFNSGNIPTDRGLKKLINRIHDETSCDVTINCVIPEYTDEFFCHSFIDYVKELGADAVSFRKVASNVAPTPAETFFERKYGVVGRSNCPVCRGMEQRVQGFPVRWKGSVAEPSIQTNGVYEVVIHPDGNPYADWSMTRPLHLGTRSRDEDERIHEEVYGYDSPGFGASCGSSGCGSQPSYGCGSHGSSCGSSRC